MRRGRSVATRPAFLALNPNALVPVVRGTAAFVTGSHFTLAGVVLGLATHRWVMTPMARPELPATQACYDRLYDRPGYRAHGRNGEP